MLGGVGAVPGAGAGSYAGGAVLSLLGLKSLVEGVVQSVPQALEYYEKGFREAWGPTRQDRLSHSLLIQHDDESALHLADLAAHILQGQNQQQDIASVQLRPDEAPEVPLEQPAQSGASMQQEAATDATAWAPPQQANHCGEEEARDIDGCLQLDDPVCAAYGLPGFWVDMGDIAQLFTEIEGRAVLIEEAGEAATAHERDGFKALDGVAHGIKTVRVQDKGINRGNAWNIENEFSGQITLPVLKFRAVFGIADAIVFWS